MIERGPLPAESPAATARLVDVRTVVVVAALVLLACSGRADPAFVPLRPGLERQASTIVGVDVDVVAFRADLHSWQARVVSAPRPRRVHDAVLAALPVLGDGRVADHVAVNASFFDPDLNAMGYVVDDHGGHGRPLPAWGALALFPHTSRVVAPGADLKALPATGLVQGLPRLVVDGAVVAGLKRQDAVRTAVCTDDNALTVVVSKGAVDAVAFADHLRRVVGCRHALNLDGGPSTQLAARVGDHSESVVGGWGVPNILLLTPR